MEQNQKSNPLAGYFRTFKTYITLPSKGAYYLGPDVFEPLEDGTIGIMPMTGKDELVLKNPDALLNGEALISVISSCAPAIKNPKALLSNDIEAIITAIRAVTYKDGLETHIKCPACEKEADYKLDLSYAIDNMEFLENEYYVTLESGLTVYVKPYGYLELMKSLHAQFEQSKVSKSVDNQTLSEEDKIKIFSKVFISMSETASALTIASIVKITDQSKNISVTDKKYITDFIQNIDRNSVNQINDLIKEINAVGIKKTFTATCTNCNHEWENTIDFNPVNFS